MGDSVVSTAKELINSSQQKWENYIKTPVLWLCFVIFLAVIANYMHKKTISSVYIDTNKLSTEEVRQLQEQLKVFDNSTFFGTKLSEINAKLQTLSWVGGSRVYRDWHKGIVVEVTPRQAVANFGSNQLIDVDGTVFIPSSQVLLTTPKFAKLYATDNNANLVMQKIQKLNVWFAPVSLSVEDIVLTPRQTWLVRFNSGLRVTTDFDRVDEKLFELSQILANNQLSIPLTEIAAIDLRYKNGFSITPKPTAKN